MQRKAKQYITDLNLEPHPEGGFFTQTYSSDMRIEFDGFIGIRSVSTAIYFLLTEGNLSAFHRIKSDEMWHFYDGDPLDIYVIEPSGELKIIHLGLDLSEGQKPQAVVPAGLWFASRVAHSGSFSLVGCTVSPGFDFQDFEMADRYELVKQFPQHTGIINELTR